MHSSASPEPVEQSVSASESEILEMPAHVDNWDEYFLNIAWAASTKSKDPKSRVGAVIVTSDNVIISTGFNGLARGVYDDQSVLEDVLEKLKHICHAEHNAIVNAARIGGHPLKGSTIFVTKFPCLACCNSIIQAGIQRIYTDADTCWTNDPIDPGNTRTMKVLRQAGIKVDAPNHPSFSPSGMPVVTTRKPPSRAGAPPSEKQAAK